MTGETYENERKRALMRRSADLGLRRAPGRPVWGVMMETCSKDSVTTIVATDDGGASQLVSTGDSVHLAKDDWPSGAATRLIGSAGDFLFECSPAWAYPLPQNGMVRFYLLTFDGVMTVEAPLRDLTAGSRPLADLFYAADDVQFLVRLVAKDRNWRSYLPTPGTASLLPEPPPEPVEVAPVEVAAPAAGLSDALLRAVSKNDVDEVATLLAQGCDCGPNFKGITPLMAASHAGALEPLRLLLAAGVPVDGQDNHGYTALMLACNAGHEVCARLLLGAGADVHSRDNEGFTALMFAAKNGHENIVRVLMERGADTGATSDRGVSAVTLATQKGHARTVSILLGK